MLGLALLSPSRSGGALAFLLIATATALGGLGLALAALFLALLPAVGPVVASVVTACACLALAALALILAWRLLRAPDDRAPIPAAVEDTAHRAAGELIAWTRDHPGQATLAAATVGFALAALPELRLALADLARGFAASQAERPAEE